MVERILQDAPASYEISVSGQLDERWSDYLGGLSIRRNDELGHSISTLSGEVIDQAALMGILNSLYDLGFSLLFVKYQS